MKRKTGQKQYKWMSIVLTAALLASNLAMAIPVNAEPVQGNAQDSVSTNTVSGNEERPEIERALTYHDAEDPVPVLSKKKEELYAERGTLPVSYSSVAAGKLPALKDQGSYGTCWAFSAIGACEAGLISQGYAGTSLDISERHLAYYFYEKGSTGDLLGGTTGDYNTALGTTSGGLPYDYKNRGGNSLFTMWHLVSWAGLVNESAAPYEYLATPLADSTPANVYGSDDYHLQNAYIINKSNQNTIKELIMDYGSMAASYYSSYSASYDQVMEDGYGCYYYNLDSGTNHAIQVVGWDDSFDKSNFAITPEGNGAWLVKNSWGEEVTNELYAQNGYFWISYYDASLSPNFFAYVCEPADNYDNIYQYDGAAGVNYYSVGSAANVYTSGANAGGIEKIEAVGIGNYANGLDYTLSIYTNLTDPTNPTSGTKVSQQTGTLEYSGYHTIPLNTPIYIEEGEKFSVVFDFGMTVSLYADSTYTNGDWLKFTTAEAAQTSFYKIGGSDTSWSDLVTAANATFRIKAYTSNENATEVIALQSIALDKTSLSMEVGNTAQLNVSYNPSNTTDDKTIVWSSSNTNVATVGSNSGIITAKGAGSTVITATCGTKTATCTVTVKDIKFAIQNVNNEMGTFTVRMARVNELAGVSTVKVAVWSAENGQDDLQWYTATSAGNGIYTLNISIANHGSKAGIYYAHAYAFDSFGNAHFWGGSNCTFTKVGMSASGISAQVSSDEETATITMTGVTGVTSLQFAVWSNVNGQDDLVWYTAQNKGNGTWSATVPISKHRYSAGVYNVHAYGRNVYVANQFIKATTFQIRGPSITQLKITDVNNGAGTFKVVVNAKGKAGIRSVDIAVWSKADQSNLRWYAATKQSDGSYMIDVNMSNHGYEYGTYVVHAYVRDNNGELVVNGKGITISQPVPFLTATGNVNETQYNIQASNVGYAGGVKGVWIAVWSSENGQDDLIWYPATSNGNGAWSINVPIINHKSAGSYSAHMYIVDRNGEWHYGANTGFSVKKPTAGTVKIKNADSVTGKFTVEVNGATAVSGIAGVGVAVWSKADQSNLRWYTATKQSDGSYRVDVDLANHGYEYGIYHAHAYVRDNNGISALTAGNIEMKQPVAFLTATGNANGTQYNIQASNVGYAGGVKGVWIAVWSSENGQDDLIWYPATGNGNGAWSINVPIINHKSAGSYSAHMYIVDRNGEWHYGANTGFSVKKPTAGTVKIKNADSGTGKFTVEVNGATAVSGIAGVDVAVWSKADQSNLRWYTATKQSDGSYRVDVDLANHGYEYGIYHAHAYVRDNNGISALTAGNIEMKQPVTFLTATGNASQTEYVIKAANVGYAGGIKGVWIAVWSNENGQDDLIWYPGTKSENGVWGITVPIRNHRSTGTYSAHMYIVDQIGNWHFVGNTTFKVM